MFSNPILRLLFLLRSHWGYIPLGGLLFMAVTFVTAIFTPYYYTSEAIIAVNPEKQDDLTPLRQRFLGNFGKKKGNKDMDKAKLLMSTNHVPLQVAKNLPKLLEGVDVPLAFPKFYSITDIRQRLRLASLVLGKGRRTASNILERKAGHNPMGDSKTLVSMLKKHLDYSPSGGNFKIQYTAATPEVAHTIAKALSETLLVELEKSIIQQREKKKKYIAARMKKEIAIMRSYEDEVRILYEQNPELAGSMRRAGSRGGTLSISTQEFLRAKTKLSELGVELSTARSQSEEIRKALLSGEREPQELTLSVRNQIIERIGQLEFKKLDLSVLRNLPGNDKRLANIESKIAKLKKLLNRINRSANKEFLDENKAAGIGGKSITALYKEREKLEMRIDRLVMQRDLLRADLVAKRNKMKKGLETEFALSEIQRKLYQSRDLVKLLAANQQKVNLESSTSNRLATLLIPASTPLFPSNLSVKKKVFFGFVVGLAFMVMLLFLFDLQDPKLLMLQDIEAIKLKHLGMFNFSEASTKNLVSHLIALRESERKEGKETGVTVLSSVSIDFNYASWAEEAMIRIQELGYKVATIRVGIQPKIITMRDTEKIKRRWIAPSDLARTYVPILNDLKKDHDWVFVIAPHLLNVPGDFIVRDSADQILHVVKLGVSRIRELVRLKKTTLEHYGVEQLCLVFKGRATVFRRGHRSQQPSKEKMAA